MGAEQEPGRALVYVVLLHFRPRFAQVHVPLAVLRFQVGLDFTTLRLLSYKQSAVVRADVLPISKPTASLARSGPHPARRA